MKIAVVIPTRGDRPMFVDHALRLVTQQTRPADFIVLVNDPPETGEKDITLRYRIGLERAWEAGADVAFLMEDDDWYSPFYIGAMILEWEKRHRPPLFGIGYSIYYHIIREKIMRLEHIGRASAYNTMVTRGLDINFPADSDPFFDLHLWKYHRGGQTWSPERPLSLGIKHGIGLCGGKGHQMMSRYVDPEYGFLQSTVDETSYFFYAEIRAKQVALS